MKEILDSLREEVGVKGCLVLTRDGMVVTSSLEKPLDEHVLAAIASSSIRTINTSLQSFQEGAFESFVINAEFGKLVFVDAGDATLVVVLDKQIQADLTMLSISSTARKIRHSGFTSA